MTAGTITPSANGREVTGSGTSWLTNLTKPYQAWYMYIDGRQYQVDFVNSNTLLTLRVPYAGTATAAGASYQAFRKYYPLEYYADKLHYVKEHSQPVELSKLSLQEKEYYYMNDLPGEIQDYPSGYVLWASQDIPIQTTYTVSADANGVEVTAASGTTWRDDDLGPGDELTISSTAFTIQRITSQTTLDLIQKISTDVSGLAATGTQKDRTFVEFVPMPNKNDVMTLFGYKKAFPLHSDNDYIEEGWWGAVRAGVIKRGFEYLKRPIGEKEDLYQQALQRLIRDQTTRSKFTRIRPSISGRYSGYF